MATYDTFAMTEMIEAADCFIQAWTDLLLALPDDYSCTMTCGEAEVAADFLRAFGYLGRAQALIQAHAEHDDPGDSHYLGAAENGQEAGQC